MSKIGRNDPCPCGSGKKYKRCHGNVAKARLATGPVQAPVQVLQRRPQPEHESLTKWMTDTLDSCVDYGCHIAVVMADYFKGGYTDAIIAALYRHFLELVDGISVLIGQHCADAAKPILRSAFETSLYIEYILQADTERRARAYLVANAHRRISFYRKLNPDTEQGKDFREKIKNDPLSKSILGRFRVDELLQKEQNLTNMLTRPEFAPIQAAWNEAKGKLEWYSLFNGPRNLEDLARHLKKSARYELLYRYWSQWTHATGAPLNRIVITPEGTGALLALRYPGDLQQVTLHTALIAVDLMRLIVKSYIPSDEKRFAEWYRKCMSNRIAHLSQIEIKVDIESH